MHKNKVLGIGGKPGQRWRRPKTLEEVRGSILRKLEAIEAGRSVAEEELARREAEWTARRSGE
ncbi:MAG TPA: hypothetical protein VGB65_01435 [Allosphingosinicella sp.]